MNLRRWSRGLLLLPLLLWACSPPPANTPAGSSPVPGGATTDASAPATAGPAPQIAPLPTLLPTYTPSATLTAIPVGPTAPPEPTATPIDFTQPVVNMRYVIPALGLDRVIEGTVSGQVTVRDETTGQAVVLSNRGGILLQMQDALQSLAADALVELPSDCTGCVYFEYSLPAAELEGRGWLRDQLLLASIENFTAAHLGPHVPDGTLVALRRSASAFEVAHTLAVDPDGQTTFWLAIDSEYVPVALPDGPAIAALAAAADPALLAADYLVDCPGLALETLYLNDAAAGAAVTSDIRCPELALPGDLLPLYAQLDAAIAPLLSDEPRPAGFAPLLPLTALLYYEAPAGRLTLYADGTVVAASETLSYTGVLTTSAVVISLTNDLLATGQLGAITPEIIARAAVTDTTALTSSLLLVRGSTATAGLIWSGTLSAPLRILVQDLDALLVDLLPPVAAPEGSETPPAPTATPPPE